MEGKHRREQLIALLQQADVPVSGTDLAKSLGVSRQVIVGDIALLRAAGADISATPRGYVIQHSPAGFVHQVACRHDAAGMEAELNLMVDQG